MIKLILITSMFLFMIPAVYSQDSPRTTVNKKLQHKPGLLTAKDTANALMASPNSNKAHVEVNSNSGLNAPATTSGTMNSTVHPNTDMAIPLHKRQKKIKKD